MLAVLSAMGRRAPVCAVRGGRHQLTASSVNFSPRRFFSEAEAEEAEPTDQQEIAKFLTQIQYWTGQQKGRRLNNCGEHADKFNNWEELTKSDSMAMRRKGIPCKPRKRILVAVDHWMRNERSRTYEPIKKHPKLVVPRLKPGYGSVVEYDENGNTRWKYPTLHQIHLDKHKRSQLKKREAKGLPIDDLEDEDWMDVDIGNVYENVAPLDQGGMRADHPD